jgi:hypothetical protein
MDIIWLQGGPYYELSLLLKNSIDKKSLIENIILKLGNPRYDFQIMESPKKLDDKIIEYIQGDFDENSINRALDLNTIVNINGERKSRLFLAELSEELVKLNFWFFGSLYDAIEWEQKGIQEIDKPYFKDFLNILTNDFRPIIATIAYEEDCDFVFETEAPYPNIVYSIENLTIEKISHRILNNDFFEYCWINGDEFKVNEDVEIFR